MASVTRRAHGSRAQRRQENLTKLLVALEDLLARIRAAANVSTRTTIVLSTYYENRPVTG